MANAKIALLGLAALVALSLGATADAAPETCAPIRQNATFNAKVDQALSPLFRKLDGMKDKNTAATKSAALSASVKRLGNSQKYRMNEKVQCLVAILVEKIDAQTSKLRSAVDNDEEFLNDVAAAVRGTDTSEPNSPTPSNPSGQGNPSSQTSSSSASTSGTQTSGGTPSDYTIGMGACILTTLDKVNLTQAGYKDSTGSSSSVL